MLFVKKSIFHEHLHDSLNGFLSILCMYYKLKNKKIHCLIGKPSPYMKSFSPDYNIISLVSIKFLISYAVIIHIKLYVRFFHGDSFLQNLHSNACAI